MPRTLTKSRFRLAQECPTKLFYTGKPDLYSNHKLEDSFLAALAEGGFQVGELAKLYHPGGIEVEGLDYEQVLRETEELMEREEVVLFEPAFEYEGLFIRVDVLVKRGNSIDLIEVKAKSCDGGSMAQFLKRDGTVKSEWQPYFEDVAFQRFVVQRAFPDAQVCGHLMLANKQAVCSEDGLHQKFLLKSEGQGGAGVEVTAPLLPSEFDDCILACIDVDAVLEAMLSTPDWGVDGNESFEAWVTAVTRDYLADVRIDSPLGAKCKGCEFKATSAEKEQGKKSGFEECWLRHSRLSAEQLDGPTVLDIWNFRGLKPLFEERRLGMDQLDRADVNYDGRKGEILTTSERQWLQVERVQRGSTHLELRKEGLKQEMETWVYPLHFIDFETAMPAIPLHRGCSPYTQLAFQYSHHLVHEDGRVEHRGEYLDTRCGEFPNFVFLRALREELGGDDGSVFRYAAHENSVLAVLREQLMASEEHDRDSLIAFIESIAHPRGGEIQAWPRPQRDMVDLLDLVKKFVFDPRTNGSNSIKKVLPATIARSSFLQTKYSAPIYGAPGGIPSLNFESMVWVQRDAQGQWIDPYDLLPSLFDEASDEQLEALVTGLGAVKEGGAAMTAWARMQFTEMTDFERVELRASLLKYCELDTLAMVMLYEAWRDWCSSPGNER